MECGDNTGGYDRGSVGVHKPCTEIIDSLVPSSRACGVWTQEDVEGILCWVLAKGARRGVPPFPVGHGAPDG